MRGGRAKWIIAEVNEFYGGKIDQRPWLTNGNMNHNMQSSRAAKPGCKAGLSNNFESKQDKKCLAGFFP